MIDHVYAKRNFPLVRPDWLARVKEDVLEFQLPIVDAHHHLWALPESTYLRDDLVADVESGHVVHATVYVECQSGYRPDGPESMRPVGETEFVLAEVDGKSGGSNGVCTGIVAWADLMLGESVQDVLEQHILVGKGRFRGIRTRCAWHEHPEIHPTGLTQPHMLLDPKLQQGARRLGAMGLTLGVWVYHTQLAEVAQLAEVCPGTTLILNHCGGPLGVGPFERRREEVFNQWREQIQALARCKNVAVKLGGLAMPRMGFGLHELEAPAGSAVIAKAWAPYVSNCVEAFGADRCMFESNFPVDKGAVSYRNLWNSFKRLAAEYSSSEKLELFSGTASRIYRLEDKLDPA